MRRFEGDRRSLIDELDGALYAGMVITYAYAQGMALLAAAS